ncbi:MFS general substrate transporter [Pyrenophora tritici-repentis]|nr:MFS general substrate transporter [Pyrenophora tritici-repentis]
MSDHQLPVKQLVILSICRFAEPIALTSVFPYVPELMESFGIPQNDIARWAGIASSSFSICQAFTGILWGAASDRYGRKPIILFGLFNTMWTMLLWGFSVNLPMALAARALGGLSNGNVGILRTTVAELCPWKELQPRAFSVMPLVWTVGATFGPTLGGALANPLGVDPRKPRGDAFLARFPYVLPNIVAAGFFTTGILVGWLFLQETLESKKHAPDLGLRTGAKLTAFFRRVLHLPSNKKHTQSEREPLLSQQKPRDSETTVDATIKVKEKSPTIRDALTYQTSLNLIVYTLLAMYTQAYDQVRVVLATRVLRLTRYSYYQSSCIILYSKQAMLMCLSLSNLPVGSVSNLAASASSSPSSPSRVHCANSCCSHPSLVHLASSAACA